MTLLQEYESSESAVAVESTIKSSTTSDSQVRIRLGRRELLNLTSQLAIMVRSGIDLTTALNSTKNQAVKPAVQEMLADIHESVLGGQPFSVALARYENAFGATYVASVNAGESAGNLPVVLSQLARMLRAQIRLRAAIRSMLIFPSVLLAASMMVIAVLVVFILPRFAEIFEQFDTPLPMLSHILISIGKEFSARFLIWGPLGIGAIGVVVAYMMSPKGKLLRHRLMISTAIVRNVTQALLIGRACRLLSLMISSGVPLLDSLRLARSAIDNTMYVELFRSLEEEVVNGGELGQKVVESPFVPAPAAQMIVTGEQTGKLSEVCGLVADHYEEDGEMALRDLVSVLEPAITVVMGIIVAVVVLSVLLPMLDIATMAQH